MAALVLSGHYQEQTEVPLFRYYEVYFGPSKEVSPKCHVLEEK